ncbi:hypothetical protein, partial [Faecalispora jeddahensis]|uniref:hypothetical protein n=1 Tax=Faecalispora jeddahensis TaxID=1414721 RepID=UPI001A9BF5A3
VPKTDSKGVLWKAFAYFRPFTKVSARPGMRGKALRQQNFPCWEEPTKKIPLRDGKSCFSRRLPRDLCAGLTCRAQPATKICQFGGNPGMLRLFRYTLIINLHLKS